MSEQPINSLGEVEDPNRIPPAPSVDPKSVPADDQTDRDLGVEK